MSDFDYAAPTSLAQATALLEGAHGTVRVLAGGTDLIVQLREHLRDADLVVNVKRIPELMELRYDSRLGLRLGAAVPYYRIYEHAEIPATYSALADAARIVGGWQIQSRASVGGNLCNSSPAADTIPALIALRAICVIASPKGWRELDAESFCTAPGRNVLQKGEILTSILFRPHAPCSGSAYERFIPRNEMDIAVVGAGSWVKLSADGTTIEQARIALGAVAPTPLFAALASQWLAGKAATEKTLERAGELAREAAAPISDMRGTAEFRRHLVGVLTRRTLAKAVERARA
ncbi:MAG: FAD binding domain-containing protein [Isosphaeraceae bacterium]